MDAGASVMIVGYENESYKEAVRALKNLDEGGRDKLAIAGRYINWVADQYNGWDAITARTPYLTLPYAFKPGKVVASERIAHAVDPEGALEQLRSSDSDHSFNRGQRGGQSDEVVHVDDNKVQYVEKHICTVDGEK
jgi:hypothetical protein